MDYSKFLKERNGRLLFSVLSLCFVVTARNMVSGFDNFKYEIDNSRLADFDIYETFPDLKYVEEDVRSNNVDFSNLDFAESDFISEFLLELCYSTGLTTIHTADPRKDFDYWSFKSEVVEKNWSELLRLFFEEGATKLDQPVLRYIEALESARTGREVQPHLTVQRLFALIASVRAYFDKKTQKEVSDDFPKLKKLLDSLLAAKPLKTVDIAAGGRMLFGGRSFPMFGRAYGGAFGGDAYGWGFGGSMWKKGSESGEPESYDLNSFGSAMWSKFHKEGEPTIGDVKNFCSKYQDLILKFEKSFKSSNLKRAIGYRILSDYLAKLYFGAGVVSSEKEARKLCSYDYVVKTLGDCLKFCKLVNDFALSMKAHPGFAKYQLEGLNKQFDLYHFPMQCIISTINALLTKVASIDLSLIDASKQPELFRFVQKFKRNNETNKVSDQRTFLDLAFTFYTTLTGLWNNEFAKIGTPKKTDDLDSLKQSTKRNFADNATNTAFDKLWLWLSGGTWDLLSENKIKDNGEHAYKKSTFNYFDQFGGVSDGDIEYNGDGSKQSPFFDKTVNWRDQDPAKFKVEKMFSDFMNSLLESYDDFDEKKLKGKYDKNVINLECLNSSDPIFINILKKDEVKNFIVGMVKTLENFKMINDDGSINIGDVYGDWARSVKEYIENVASVKAFEFATYKKDTEIDRLLYPNFKSSRRLKLDNRKQAINEWAQKENEIKDSRLKEVLEDGGIDYGETFKTAKTNFENNSLKFLFDKLLKIGNNGLASQFPKNEKNTLTGKEAYNGEVYGWLKQLADAKEIKYNDGQQANFKVDKMFYDFIVAFCDRVDQNEDEESVRGKFKDQVKVLRSMEDSGNFPNIDSDFIEAIEKSENFIVDFVCLLKDYVQISADKGDGLGREQFLNKIKGVIDKFSKLDLDKQKEALAFATYDLKANFEDILGFDLSDNSKFTDGTVSKAFSAWALESKNLKDDRRKPIKVKSKKTVEKSVLDGLNTIKLAEKAIGDNAANAVFDEIEGLSPNTYETFKKPDDVPGKIKIFDKNNFGNSVYKYFKELFKIKDTAKYKLNVAPANEDRYNFFEYDDDNTRFSYCEFKAGDPVKTKTDVMFYNFMNSLCSNVDDFKNEEKLRSNFRNRIEELKKLASQKADDGNQILKNLNLDFIKKIAESEDFIINLVKQLNQFRIEKNLDYDGVYGDWASAVGMDVRKLIKKGAVEGEDPTYISNKIPFVEYLSGVSNTTEAEPIKVEDVLGFKTEDLNKITTPIFDSENPDGGKITPTAWGSQSNDLVDDRYDSDDVKVDVFVFDKDATQKATLDSFAQNSTNAVFDEFVGFDANEKVDIKKQPHKYKHSVYNYFSKLVGNVNDLRYGSEKVGRTSNFNEQVVNIKTGEYARSLVEQMLFYFMKALCTNIDSFKKEDLGKVFDKHIKNLKVLCDDASQLKDGGKIDKGFIDKLVAAKDFIIELAATPEVYNMDETDYGVYEKLAKKVAGVIKGATEDQLAFAGYQPEGTNLTDLSKFFDFNSNSDFKGNFLKMQGEGSENKKLHEWAVQDFNLVDGRDLPDIVSEPTLPPPPPEKEPELKIKPPETAGDERDNWFKVQARLNFKNNSANVVANRLKIRGGSNLKGLRDSKNLFDYFGQFAETPNILGSHSIVKNKDATRFKKDVIGCKFERFEPKDFAERNNASFMFENFVYEVDKNTGRRVKKKDVNGADLKEYKFYKKVEDRGNVGKTIEVPEVMYTVPDIVYDKKVDNEKCGFDVKDKSTTDYEDILVLRPAKSLALTDYQTRLETESFVQKRRKRFIVKDSQPVKVTYAEGADANFKVETLFYNLMKCAATTVIKGDNFNQNFASKISNYVGVIKKLKDMQYTGDKEEKKEKKHRTTMDRTAFKEELPCYVEDLDGEGKPKYVNVKGKNRKKYKTVQYKTAGPQKPPGAFKEKKVELSCEKKQANNIKENMAPKQYIDSDFVETLSKATGFLDKLMKTLGKLKEGSPYAKWSEEVRKVIDEAKPEELEFVEYEQGVPVDQLIVLDYDAHIPCRVVSSIGRLSNSTMGALINSDFSEYVKQADDITDAKGNIVCVMNRRDRLEAFLRTVQLARELFYVPKKSKRGVLPGGHAGAPGPGAPGVPGGHAPAGVPGPGVPGVPVPPGVPGVPAPPGAPNPNKFTAEELKRTNGEALGSFVEGIKKLRDLIDFREKVGVRLDNPNKLKGEDLKRTNGETLQSFVDAMKTLSEMFKPQYKKETIVEEIETEKKNVDAFSDEELKRNNGDMLSSFVNAIKTLRELFKPVYSLGNMIMPKKVTNEERLNSFISAIGALRELAKPDKVVAVSDEMDFYEQINNGLQEVVFAKSKTDVDNKIKFLDNFFGSDPSNFENLLMKAIGSVDQDKKIKDLMLTDFNPYGQQQQLQRANLLLKSCLPTEVYKEMFFGIDLKKKKLFKIPSGVSGKLPLVDGRDYTLGRIIANLTKEMPCSFSEVSPEKDVVLQFAGVQADLKIGVSRSGWVKNFISLDELKQLFNAIKDKSIELVDDTGAKYTGKLGDYIGGKIYKGIRTEVSVLNAGNIYVSDAKDVDALVKSFGSLKTKRKTEEDLEYGDLNQATNRSLEKILKRYDERVSADVRNFSKRVDRRISEEQRWFERRNYLINCYNYLVNKSNMLTQRINHLFGSNYKVYDDLNSNLNLRDKVLQNDLGFIDDPNVVSIDELDNTSSIEKLLDNTEIEELLDKDEIDLDKVVVVDQSAETNVAANSKEALQDVNEIKVSDTVDQKEDMKPNKKTKLLKKRNRLRAKRS